MKRTDLHEYQNYCVEFLKTHREAMLILEMGLGKSAISLTAILDLMFDSFDVGKVLVIAPHFMGNRWGNSGNSVRLYFWGLQNHYRW